MLTALLELVGAVASCAATRLNVIAPIAMPQWFYLPVRAPASLTILVPVVVQPDRLVPLLSFVIDVTPMIP